MFRAPTRRLHLMELTLASSLLLASNASNTLAQEDPAPQSPLQEASAEDPAVSEARERIGAAKLLYDQRDYASALTELERVYELVPAHPVRFEALYNIARCYERLFRYDSALAYYRRYLEESGLDAQRRAEVATAVEQLETRLATLTIESNVAADVWINGHLVGHAPGRLQVPSGLLTVELRAVGYEPRLTNVQLASRQHEVLRVALERLSRVSGASPALFWVSATVAGVAAATGTVLGVIALSKNDEIESKLSDDTDRWRVTQSEEDSAHDFALGADIAFASSALFATASVVLFFLTDWEDDPRERARPSRPALTLVPIGGARESGLLIEGRLP